MDRDLMRDVLTRNPSNDLMLKRTLEAIGCTDGCPLFRAWHTVFDAATSLNARSAVFVRKLCRRPQKLWSRASPNGKTFDSGNFLRLYVGTT